VGKNIPELRVFEMTKIITFYNSTNKFSFPISRIGTLAVPGFGIEKSSWDPGFGIIPPPNADVATPNCCS